jgi:hypothetical protein
VRNGFAKQDAPALARILCARMERVNEVAFAGQGSEKRALPRRLSFLRCFVSEF